MKILIEGEKYSLDALLEVFDDPKFFVQEGAFGTVNCVGYYHSFNKKNKDQLVYILPKVFVKTFMDKISPQELFQLDFSETIKHNTDFIWARQLVIYFYNSLAEFRKRYRNTVIIESSQSFELNSNLGLTEYSYLDLVLSFVNFYRKNKNTILYRHVEFISSQAKKAKWERTIRTSLPVLSNGVPVYLEIKNKKKIVNQEEELISYFFSILNHFKSEHGLSVTIDKSYKIIAGKQFKQLQRTGLSKLRKIKHRYFADSLKRIYQLCEIYFSKTDLSSPRRKNEEFISVRNYNIVFEDMIDKLFSEKVYNETTSDEISIEKLKHNKDGKIIDHIYDYSSIIDTDNIFYIGDSKYYKPDTEAGKLSVYKQFTYSKNVIQFNIDLLNEEKPYENIRYRDPVTEGYNISPNFFIYGAVTDVMDFDNPILDKYGSTKESFHFRERLFDRDSLFVLQYQINFLFVLKYYTTNNFNNINEFRKNTKAKFRKEFIHYFNAPDQCGFTLYEKDFDGDDLKSFVNSNFRVLNGKAIKIKDNTLLVAIYHKDENKSELKELIQDFKTKDLSELLI